MRWGAASPHMGLCELKMTNYCMQAYLYYITNEADWVGGDKNTPHM